MTNKITRKYEITTPLQWGGDVIGNATLHVELSQTEVWDLMATVTEKGWKWNADQVTIVEIE